MKHGLNGDILLDSVAATTSHGMSTKQHKVICRCFVFTGNAYDAGLKLKDAQRYMQTMDIRKA